MTSTIRFFRNWRYAALAAIVLCAQAYTVAHEATHAPGGDTENCVTCSLGGAVKHVTVATEPSIPEPAWAAAPVTDREVTNDAPARRHAEARAPPLHT